MGASPMPLSRSDGLEERLAAPNAWARGPLPEDSRTPSPRGGGGRRGGGGLADLEVKNPLKLLDRVLVVVDGEVDGAVVRGVVPAALAGDVKGGGLLAAAVAAGAVGRVQRRQHPPRQRAG